MPDLAAWAAELGDAAKALRVANLILADHLLTNVQLKIRALRMTALLEAAQSRKTVLPAATAPRASRKSRADRGASEPPRARKRSVIDQLCKEE